MKAFLRRLIAPGFFRKYLVFLLLLPLGYLCQVCVMPYLKIGGITPNLLYVNIAIITVAYGRVQALWAGLIYGFLMEIMVPGVRYVHLAVYPVSSLFVSFVFADKTLRRLQMDRAMKRNSREIPPLIRTVLCAMVNVLVYETVNVAYIYLQGSDLTPGHFWRAGLDIFLTGLLCLLLSFFIRPLILGRRRAEPVLKNQPIVFGRK
ncbi:MAG: hypothetical protein IKE24_02200 [Clostridia bacterium]|nr:hypothetical protein [Clostridia bacterium]